MRKLTLALAAAATLGLGLIAAGEASARPGHGWGGRPGGHFAGRHWGHRPFGHHRPWRWRHHGYWGAPFYGAAACEWARVPTPWGPRWRRVCF